MSHREIFALPAARPRGNGPWRSPRSSWTSPKSVFDGFKVPFASLDVLHDGTNFHLGEFQFLRFGCGPVMNSTHYWGKDGGSWHRVDERTRFEPAYVKAIADFMERP